MQNHYTSNCESNFIFRRKIKRRDDKIVTAVITPLNYWFSVRSKTARFAYLLMLKNKSIQGSMPVAQQYLNAISKAENNERNHAIPSTAITGSVSTGSDVVNNSDQVNNNNKNITQGYQDCNRATLQGNINLKSPGSRIGMLLNCIGCCFFLLVWFILCFSFVKCLALFSFSSWQNSKQFFLSPDVAFMFLHIEIDW